MTKIYLGNNTNEYILNSGRKITLSEDELSELTEYNQTAIDKLEDKLSDLNDEVVSKLEAIKQAINSLEDIL